MMEGYLPPLENYSSTSELDNILPPSIPRMPRIERRHTICAAVRPDHRPPCSAAAFSAVPRKVADPVIQLNCAGEVYEIRRSKLRAYPATLLGSDELETFYRPEIDCYFFDRNRPFFEHVVQFYMCGRLNLLHSFDSLVVRRELSFFRIDPSHPPASSLESEEVESEEGARRRRRRKRRKGAWRRNLFRFLNEPTYSWAALCYCILDVVLVISALGLMMLETDKALLPDVDDPESDTHHAVHIADKFFMSFFTFDVILRLIAWPEHAHCGYFADPMNVIDVVALSPYYVQHIVSLLTTNQDVDVVSILRASRLLRMVRIFRFIRHSEELFQIMRFVYETRSQLAIIYVFTHMVVLVFGALMYYVEGGEHFNSILSASWWSLVTLSTLGYGDKVPSTLLGCLVGSVALMIGMVILSLPMTIVVSKFAEWYDTEKKR